MKKINKKTRWLLGVLSVLCWLLLTAAYCSIGNCSPLMGAILITGISFCAAFTFVFTIGMDEG